MQAEHLIKTAHLLGVTRAMLEQGYTFAGVKQAYVKSGMFPEHVAEDLVKSAAELDMNKEAVWGAVAGLAAKAAPWLLRGAKAVGQFAGSAGGKLIGRGGTVAPAIGRGITNAGGAVAKGMTGMATAPGATAWGGLKNYGKGALYFGGQGVGGALGKATAGAGIAAGAGKLIFGNRQQPPTQSQYGG